MALVKRANCERCVPDDKVKEYLELGYSLIDKSGNVLEKGKAQSKEDLLVAFNEATAEIEGLKAENESLKDEIVRLKKEVDALRAENESLSNGAETSNKDVFKCPYCDKEYKSQNALDKHINEQHADELDKSQS